MTSKFPSTLFLKSKITWIILIGLISSLGFYVLANSNSYPKKRKINPAFAKYISAYTAGSISKEASIKIQLTSQITDSLKLGIESDLFSFSPSIKGTIKWIDANTIEFKPDQALESGENYEATFALGKIMDVPKELEEFEFGFTVIQQSFEVEFPNLETTDKEKLIYQRITGELLTADADDEKKVEQLLQVVQDGKKFAIKWEHAADRKTHRYIVDSLIRKKKESEVLVEWNGDALDVDLKGKHQLMIPALGDFKVIKNEINNGDEQSIVLHFSDPLLSNQDLSGLIQISQSSEANQNTNFKFTIEGNSIKCYPESRLFGAYLLQVFPGIKNILNYPLKNAYKADILLDELKPSVKFTGKGVIMPASKNLMIPFEAVSLKAVDVTVIRIYENNVAQFLQVNNLQGNYEMTRVGRPVVKKTIKLDVDRLVNLHTPNQFAIQLDELVDAEPGAIYHVKLSFKQSYAIYSCSENIDNKEEEIPEDMNGFEGENWEGGQESSYWDASEEYYDNEFNWNERGDPCKKSYYNPERWATKNFMASNIGLMSKKGANDDFTFFVNDIQTTKPLSGVQLDVLDFQQQLIISLKSDGNGMAKAKLNRKAFLLVASYQKQKAYLKLDDGSSLPVSHFDVSGDIIQKGLKGFIYGERGVWRPGDSIYLSFILEDRNKVLPAVHPVSMELYDASGVLHRRQVESKSLNGFYNFRTCTDPEAATGNWTVKIKAGSVSFQKTLKIETVMPNRLKIEFDFGKAYLSKNDDIKTILKSKWLHGSPANGLRAQVDVSLSQQKTVFKRFEEYQFDDNTRNFSAESKTIFDDKLNQNGEATISTQINPESRSAGVLNASFITKVFEAGGNFSIDRISIPYHPYSNYYGIKMPKGDKTRGMLLTDTTHTIQIVNLNPDGTYTTGTKKVHAKLYKINWRWWWDQSEDDLSMYNDNEGYEVLKEEDIQLVNGKGIFKFKINYPDWGRYLVKIQEDDGHSSSKTFYCDWPGWAGRAQRDNPIEASMLSFSTDKSLYKVGENMQISIPSSIGGRALISIESGSKVIETHWVDAKQGQTNFNLTISKEMMPNVYVHVTLLQPHAQVVNDLPIRLYGMVPITVQDPQTILKPIIGTAAVIRPDENSSISVSEASGKAMTYTLAIVDEGLLDLTRFKTPDPYSKFYTREALGVKTFDLYDYVMGAFGMQMNRILSIGGDEGIDRKSDKNKANRFKPVVKFIGPFHLKAGETAKHQIKIENYIGSVRVMVVAGYDGAYGFAEKAVPVKSPLMVLASLPRVLGPSEHVKLPVTIFALENQVRNVDVEVISNELIKTNGANKKSIKFNKPGDAIVEFDLKVAKNTGIGKVKIVASSGTSKAVYEVELDVRNANPYQTKIFETTLSPAKSWEQKLVPFGLAGTNSAVIEVSSIPALNLEKRLRYLVQYPHGCIEQTTSSVFPQLGLNFILDLDDYYKKETEKNIKAGIQKIKQFQTSEGGLSYWQGESNVNEWGTNYAGHFMLEAQEMGYTLPVNFLSNWKTYQRSKALSWMPATNSESGSDLMQAYRLYTLALAKSAELGAMNRLKEKPNLSENAKWRLAAAYALVGQKEVGLKLIQNLGTDVKFYQEMDYTFGSDTRDEAMILETLILLGENNKANMVMLKIAKDLGSEMWMSTQTTGFALLSISKLCGKISNGKNLQFEYSIGGKTVQVDSQKRISQIKVPMGMNGNDVKINNTGSQLIFVRSIVKGQPENGEETEAKNNLNFEIVYKDKNGNIINPQSIPQGSDFKMEISISNPGILGNYEQMALTQIIPSGWEIHNTRMDENNALVGNYSQPRYQDIRDDRVYSYFSLGSKQKVTYCLLLNASYAGRYYLPAISCEAMYDGRIFARSKGYWVEVVPRK
ncbi:MAG: alpha-2-macroglobulin family protein [Bacteroidia bacterium]